jgi:hypothetical protein
MTPFYNDHDGDEWLLWVALGCLTACVIGLAAILWLA